LSNWAFTSSDILATEPELNQVMASALFQLQKIIDKDVTQNHNFLSIATMFLNGIISTTADLVNHAFPGTAQVLYADIE
jgi:hypothetical protein